ncbi:MAG TPA: DUF3604 domain-containing protein [Clostridiaceae bacterium]|nr:DUF3604 domain-containing protein [Clostridiaceae bacterium]
MNVSYRKYTEEREFWPYCDAICSSKFIDIKPAGDKLYAATQYFHDGEEGVLVVWNDSVSTQYKKIKTKSSTAIFPKLCVHGDDVVFFWSEYIQDYKKKGSSNWVLHYCSLNNSLEKHWGIELEGDVFVTDLCSFDGSIFAICENCCGNESRIIILEILNNGEYKKTTLSEGNIFAKRARACIAGDKLAVAWDGYGPDGYDIYYCEYKRKEGLAVSRVTSGKDWFLNPSIVSNDNGDIYLSFIKSVDVARDGVIGRAETVCVVFVDNGLFRHIKGPDGSDSVINLYMGLLPAERYFGYVGLRRNPQLSVNGDGSGVLLTWEKHRSEEEIWDNVENGEFMCLELDKSGAGNTYILHSGGNSFTRLVKKQNGFYYACRAERKDDIDIEFFKMQIEEKDKIELPYFEKWDGWKPVDLGKYEKLEAKGEKIYWGDLHCHSMHSADAEGFADELYFYARDKAHLDFSGITDNDYYYDTVFTYSESMYIESVCRAISEEGRFICFNGFEWTFYEKGSSGNFNHRSVVFYNEERRIARRSDKTGNSFDRFIFTMKDVKAEWHAHHAVWKLSDHPSDNNVEITSAWKVNMEIADTVGQHLDKGMVFGFMGSSDNHRYIPGNSGALTGVYASELSRKGLIEAFKNRKVYATTGNRTILNFSVEGIAMGGIVKDAKDILHITLSIDGRGRSIDTVQIIADKRTVVKEFKLNDSKFTKRFQIENKGYKYLYARVLLSGEYVDYPHNIAMAEGIYAWSSPVFLR